MYFGRKSELLLLNLEKAFKSDPDDWRKKIIDENMCRPVDRDAFRDCHTEPCPYFEGRGGQTLSQRSVDFAHLCSIEWSSWGACWAKECLSDGTSNMTRACRHGTVGQRGCERSIGIGYLRAIGPIQSFISPY